MLGIHGSNVDELQRANDNQIKKLWPETHQQFETSRAGTLPIASVGFNIERSSTFFLHGPELYVELILEIYNNSNFFNVRLMRMQFAWLANSKLDLLFEIS